MAGLKELRTRIESIKSTQKITSAMKMVAAARLRRAQELLARSQTYADSLTTIAGRVYRSMKEEEERLNVSFIYPKLMMPKAQVNKYLLVAFSSDRGLCGSYNASVIKETIRRLQELRGQGKEVRILCIGKKVGDVLRHRYPEAVSDVLTGIAAKVARNEEVENVFEPVMGYFITGEFDACELVYTRFHSAINREVVSEPFLPVALETEGSRFEDKAGDAFYDYDAEKQKILADLLPLLIVSRAFQALVNSQAAEHGARMTSMDNATRNAKDMISRLTLRYNRIRQTAITTELVEIIAGAEAL